MAKFLQCLGQGSYNIGQPTDFSKWHRFSGKHEYFKRLLVLHFYTPPTLPFFPIIARLIEWKKEQTQGDHKGSPLLCTIISLQMELVHCRGDPLWSP